MIDVKGFAPYARIEHLHKGWSPDQKFRIGTLSGEDLLVRVADVAEYDRKKTEYGMLKRAAALDIPMSRPIDFGFCGGGTHVYSLLTWCEGEDAEELLPRLPNDEKYSVGLKSGELLRKLHTLPAPENAEPWGSWFRRKVKGCVEFYQSHPVQSENADLIVKYLSDNQGHLDGRPQTFNHGDFHTSNLIVTPDERVGAIDFNGYNRDYGDPWWEFCSVGWGDEADAHYMTGLFNGYFGERPPHEFFLMQAYYFAYDALAGLCSTAENDGGEPETGRRHVENVLRWFDDMKNPIPVWYLSE